MEKENNPLMSQSSLLPFLQIIPDCILIINYQGYFLGANDQALELLGYGLDELLKLRLEDIVDPKDLARQPIRYDDLRAGKTLQMERQILRKDGSGLSVEVSSRAIDGERMLGVVRDISERKKAEEAVRQKEKYFRSMIERSYDVMALLDRQQKITYISPAIQRVLGYTPEERMGKNLLDLIHPQDLEKLLEDIKKVYGLPGFPLRNQVRARHLNGSWRTMEFVAMNLLEDPDINAVVVNYRDVTERQEAEEALRKQERYFRSLVEGSWDVVLLLDKEGVVRYISPSVERTLGYKPQERIGTRTLDYIHPDDRAQAEELFLKLFKNPGMTGTAETRLRHKDGTWRNIEVTATNLLQDPSMEGIILNYHDLTERKAAEAAARESHDRFQRLAEITHEGLMIHDKGIVVDVNQALASMMGYSISEMIGKSGFSFLETASVPMAKKRMEEGFSDPYEVVACRKDGTFFPAELQGGNYQYKDKNLRILRVWDITQRKKAEQALRESEERYRLLVESSPEAVVVNDENILYVNPAGVRMFGASSPEELVGRLLLDFVPAEERIRELDNLHKTAGQNQSPAPVEQKILRLDGRIIDILCNSIPFFYQGKKAVLAMFSDISERKIAEKKLWESEERFRGIFEYSPMGIGLVALDSTIVLSNAKFCEMSGYSSQELVGRSCHAITYPSDIEMDVKYLSRLGAGELSHYAIEKRYVRKDGSILWAYLIGALIRDDSGKPVYLLAMVEDLTARKEAERKAQKYQKLAVLGELAAGLAHEIRNPTAVISAKAQYLIKKQGKGWLHNGELQDMLVQCERLETLVRDVLDYSPEKKFEEREKIPVRPFLAKALRLAQTQFGPGHNRFQVKWKLGARLAPLRINPGRMERVLVNLILNAFQAMPKGGTLRLKAEQGKNNIVLRVEDNGKGISDAELPKLFEPFFTSRKTGSGLGLAICQKIVEEHQGQIRAEQLKPQGAAFIVEIPLRKRGGA